MRDRRNTHPGVEFSIDVHSRQRGLGMAHVNIDYYQQKRWDLIRRHRRRRDDAANTAEEDPMSNALPKGWDEDRVRQVLDHYESQSEDEQFAEIEAAFEQEDTVTMSIPASLAREVRALIARSSRH
jgi:hypothetical protein